MRVDNDATSWGLAARLLHWIVAVLLIGQLATGWLAENAADRETGFALIRTHFQFGVVLVGLIVLRVLWRLGRRPPAPPPGEPRWRNRMAGAVHASLYAMMILLPVSGYVIWIYMNASMSVFGLFDAPRLFVPPAEDESLRAAAWYLHHYAGWTLAGLVAVHVGAALFHQLVLRDGVLRRMA